MDSKEDGGGNCNQDRCLCISNQSDRQLGRVKWYDAVKVPSK